MSDKQNPAPVTHMMSMARWMSIDQINEQIAALEAELRSRAALAAEGRNDG